MSVFQIPFQSTGYFSKLICDYISKDEKTQSLYGNFPNLKGFEKQIQFKYSTFSEENRAVLVKSLKDQYKDISTSELTQANINSLQQKNSFTVVTGHQLNIFTGPLYFLYKIVSTIKLCRQLKEEFPKENFIPVYWMATEDHDFEEINHFFLENKKIVWDVESSGPVGRKSTEGIDLVFEAFSKNIRTNKNTEYLQKLFEEAYLKHGTLTAATRYLVNELFGEYGLVIIDGDEADLKRQFIPFIKKELVEKFSHQSIRDTNSFLEENYKVQVNPREVNLFYIENNLRERIVIEENSFRINNTDKLFSQEELLTELDNHPEKFSPNVILRPLYQEVILPNLCYIGGGGELAYWLQLKELFAAAKISFPILLLRNSVLLSTRKLAKKINNLELEYQDLFLKQEQLCNRVVENSSKIELNFDAKRQKIQEIFEELKPLVTQTDITFKGALEAQEKKQLKGIQNLEKRLLKAEKRKHKDVLDRTKRLQNSLFPRYGLQERNVNFSVFYAEFGQELIPRLIKELEPLESEFSIIEM